jgi:hypothetical protein
VLYQFIYYFDANISLGWVIFRHIIPHFIYTVIVGVIVNAVWPGGLWGKS